MKIKIDEFRTDTAQPIEAPLDFNELCAFLAASQAETPTARLARHETVSPEHFDHANPAVAVLLAVPGRQMAANGAPGSFHAAAAARFTDGSQ